MLLNVTIQNQSELYMLIRQLEFALLQLIQQVDGPITAIQYVLLGKLPITLIDPSTLHCILRTVSLHLPENYELIASNKMENIHLYYELVKSKNHR
jgi:hypothetical protein